jgi:hypothetical protein
MAATMKTVTIGLSTHRCEIIPLAVSRMRQNDVIILEEPPGHAFDLMLSGNLGISDYLLEIETEYPDFSRQMCEALRQLRHEGYLILQVEPYLERLLRIHDRFSEGQTPADLKDDRLLWPVYEMERRATRALIEFYHASAEGSFETQLAAVKRFAKLDAQRFVMRDRLRADTIAGLIENGQPVYVEAGQMHVGLAQMLRQRLPGPSKVTTDFLVADIIKAWPGPSPIFGPGDLLTLIYRFNPEFDGPLANLFIARALVQNKLITKTEILDTTDAFPHTRDEAESINLVQQLSIEACEHLLSIIGKMTTSEARRAVGAARRKKALQEAGVD